jgi:hypothetical protein
MTGRSGSFWPDTYLATLSGARKAESDLWRSLRQWSSKSGLWPKGIGWDTTWQTYANLSYDSHMIHETMWIYYDLPRGNDPICAILRTIQSLEGLRFVPDLEVHWWSLMIWFELPFFFTVINLKIFLIIVYHWYPGCIYLILSMYLSFYLAFLY